MIGAPRSGTTLLRIMLSSHPRIYIPPESDFIPRLYLGRARAAMSPDRRCGTRSRLANRRFLHSGAAARPRRLRGCPRLTPAALLDASTAYAAQHGAARWGDKSPIYTRHIPLLAEIFPSAVRAPHQGRARRRVVHARRLPRPLLRRRVRRGEVLAAEGAGRPASGLALDPAHYTELRYEDLTADPEGRCAGSVPSSARTTRPRCVNRTSWPVNCSVPRASPPCAARTPQLRRLAQPDAGWRPATVPRRRLRPAGRSRLRRGRLRWPVRRGTGASQASPPSTAHWRWPADPAELRVSSTPH